MRTWTADASVYFLGALLLLTLPLRWLLAAVIAAVIHELCHMLAVRLLGGTIMGVTIGPGGAVMETTPFSRGKELVCALAGPVGSLLLLSLCRWIPRIALCAGVQALYNLLPVYPLDGGRVLHCAAGLVLPERTAGTICRGIEGAVIFGIFLLSAAAALVWHWGLMPLLMAFVLLWKKNTLQTNANRGTIGLP